MENKSQHRCRMEPLGLGVQVTLQQTRRALASLLNDFNRSRVYKRLYCTCCITSKTLVSIAEVLHARIVEHTFICFGFRADPWIGNVQPREPTTKTSYNQSSARLGELNLCDKFGSISPVSMGGFIFIA